MKRIQKTVRCPICNTKHVLKARETSTGWTTNYQYHNHRPRIMCQCGNLFYSSDPLDFLDPPDLIRKDENNG